MQPLRTPSSDGASLFQPGHNCWQALQAGRATMLVDADNYFRAFVQAAMRATHSIIILAWDFHSRTQLRCDDVDGEPPAMLGPFLNYLVARRRGLHIYVLDWDYPIVFGTDREIPPFYGLGWMPRRRVHVRYDNTHPAGASHHQKVVVIDDRVAFAGGLDLTSRRWDTCEHRGEDPRRSIKGGTYPPFHDVMTVVDGGAARALGVLARERWQRATGETIPASNVGADPWPDGVRPDLTDASVAISRTMPESEPGSGVREVEALYLDMIAGAQRCIYIENQYFTSHKLARALQTRLAEKNGPEVILVLRLLSHGWLEEHTMEVLRTQLIRKLRESDRHGRFGVYYPHVPGLKEGTCVDIHSKVMIVDDEWLRIGSANLCNRSMGLDTECDLTFEAGAGRKPHEAIRRFRNTLLGEHLDVEVAAVEKAHAATSGSLKRTIESLQGRERTLRTLDELKDWPESVVEMAALADPDKPPSVENLMENFTAARARKKSRFPWRPLLIAIGVFAGLTALWRFTPLAEIASAEHAIELARSFAGQWWAPLLVVAAYAPACLTLFPRPLITLFAVVAFGPWLGFAYAMAGILIAAGMTYLMGAMLDPATVRRHAGEKLSHISEILRTRGLLAMTALRLVPLAPFAVEGLVAGAIRVKLWQFMLGTFLGMLPGTLATTVFGDQVSAALEDPGKINYWLLGGVALALVASSVAVKKWLFDGAPGKTKGRKGSCAGSAG